MIFKHGVSMYLKSNSQGFSVPFSYTANIILVFVTRNKAAFTRGANAVIVKGKKYYQSIKYDHIKYDKQPPNIYVF